MTGDNNVGHFNDVLKRVHRQLGISAALPYLPAEKVGSGYYGITGDYYGCCGRRQ